MSTRDQQGRGESERGEGATQQRCVPAQLLALTLDHGDVCVDDSQLRESSFTTQALFPQTPEIPRRITLRSEAADVQGVDELSRRWMRGVGEVGEYLRRLPETVAELHSTIGDMHETMMGDAAIVTCWLDQDYRLDGAPPHVSGPATVALRREDGEWRITLFHFIPLPTEAS